MRHKNPIDYDLQYFQLRIV